MLDLNKNILDNFPIKYNENLSEFSWTIDDCCNGWFIKENTKDKHIRAHAGCDEWCDKELSEIEWDNYLHLQMPTYPRSNNEVLEFLLFKDNVKWIVRVIPTNSSKLFTMNSSLQIALYNF